MLTTYILQFYSELVNNWLTYHDNTNEIAKFNSLDLCKEVANFLIISRDELSGYRIIKEDKTIC